MKLAFYMMAVMVAMVNQDKVANAMPISTNNDSNDFISQFAQIEAKQTTRKNVAHCSHYWTPGEWKDKDAKNGACKQCEKGYRL